MRIKFLNFLLTGCSTKSRAKQDESAAATYRGILVYTAKMPQQQLYWVYWGIISKIFQWFRKHCWKENHSISSASCAVLLGSCMYVYRCERSAGAEELIGGSHCRYKMPTVLSSVCACCGCYCCWQKPVNCPGSPGLLSQVLPLLYPSAMMRVTVDLYLKAARARYVVSP